MTELVFADRVPADGGGWYAHYGHQPSATPGWRGLDLRAVLDVHAERWLEDYDAWHAEVCRRGLATTRWWWLTAASRPNVWVQHDLLKPLFVAAALREWADAHPEAGRVHVLGAPAALAEYARECGLDVSGAVPSAAGGVSPVRRVLGDVRAHVRQWLRDDVHRRPAPVGAATLFYSHVLRAADLAASGDHYFGSMPALTGAAVTYLLHDPRERQGAEAALLGGGARASFVLDHLTRADVAWVVATALATWRRARVMVLPAVRLGRHTSRAFAARFRAAELAPKLPLIELAVYRALGRLLVASPAVRTIVYPYEEKGVERALLASAGKAGIATAGFAHAAHTHAHLALRSRLGVGVTPPQPDRLLATGPAARELLVHWARKPAPTTLAVGSPRHGSPLADRRDASARRAALRVLVIAGHGFELGQLANLVAARSPFIATDDVVVRKYPYAWAAAQEDGVARLAASVPGLRTGGGTLAAQLAWADVVVFDSTTAGLQAMQAGRLAIRVALHEVFDAEPLMGAPGIFARCHGGEELAAALAAARALDDAGYDAWVARQRALADSILAPLDAAALAGAVAGAASRPSTTGRALAEVAP
jgi:hypothetical protein